MTKERKLNILYNAFTLLVDKTIEQYDDIEDWKKMICNEIGCSREELDELWGCLYDI